MGMNSRRSGTRDKRYLGSAIVPVRNATIGIAMARHFDPVTLRLFVAVCEERNIARAAEREAIVPSAVSKRITAIEEEIGAPLLVRGRRGIAPTAAGEALLRQARDVLGAMERMHVELSEFTSGVHGSVRVVASVSVLAERLPDDIGAFLKRYQSVRVSLDERVSADIVRNVREGAADLGVLWDFADMAGLQIVPYRSDHLCVAVHPEHPLARRKRVRFADTLGHAAIGVAPGGMMETMLRRQAALIGRSIVYRVQVSSLDAACRIVAAGLGLAVMPREAISHDVSAAGLALLPLAEPWAERRFVLCSRGEAGLSATARLLVEHLATKARE
jgi:DNA-binding transcriptional LysR family regulator